MSSLNEQNKNWLDAMENKLQHASSSNHAPQLSEENADALETLLNKDIAQHQALLESTLPFDQLFRAAKQSAAAPAKKSFFGSLEFRWASLALTTACAVLLIIKLQTPSHKSNLNSTQGALNDSGIRIKGEHFRGFVLTAHGPKAIESNTIVHPGEKIQFKFNPGDHRFGMIVGLDAKGVVSLYFGENGKSLPVQPEKMQISKYSIELDGTEGPERFFALFSDSPQSFTTIQTYLKKQFSGADSVLEITSIPGFAKQDSFYIVKEAKNEVKQP